MSAESKLEAEGQTTIFEPEQSNETQPEPEIHRCKDCGAVLVEKVNRKPKRFFLAAQTGKPPENKISLTVSHFFSVQP